VTVRLLTDEDVLRLLTMADAIECIEDAFRRHAAGTLVAPARSATDLEAGQLVFTSGAVLGSPGQIGFRVYDSAHFGDPRRAELVAVFSTGDGSLSGLVAGRALGPMRTGAIGGVAVRHLARTGAESLGLVGTGAQARTQLRAACAVRSFSTITAFSRNPARRAAFAEEMSGELGVTVEPVETAEQAVREADVVICSTISEEPVIDPEWVRPGVHVQNVGPKFKGSHEIPIELYRRGDVLVTDAPAQLADAGDRFLLSGTPENDRVIPLGRIVAGDHPGRTGDDQLTLFCSLGLAGTEVALAAELLNRAS